MAHGRILTLEGIHNFRDFGGYPVAGGGRLRSGRLWRSGQHHGATDADLTQVAALGLTAVYDLRTDQERGLHPCRRPAGFAATVHCAPSPSLQNAPHLAAARTPQRQRDAASARAGMRRVYGTMIFRPELTAMIGRMLTDLAAGEEAILVNCMAGKDRTGIAVAALHLVAGVHHDDIVADYLLTNTAGNIEARIRAGGETIKAVTGAVDEEVLHVLMGVEAEYLEAAFAAMREERGSEDAWLEQDVGVDAALRARLREKLVGA